MQEFRAIPMPDLMDGVKQAQTHSALHPMSRFWPSLGAPSLSELILQKQCSGSPNFCKHAPSSPALQIHLNASYQVVEENLLETFGEAGIVYADVALFMKGERSIVEVCGPYGAPGAIGNHGLLVEHRAVVFI